MNANFDTRVTGLLEANGREVERRRKAEAETEQLKVEKTLLSNECARLRNLIRALSVGISSGLSIAPLIAAINNGLHPEPSADDSQRIDQIERWLDTEGSDLVMERQEDGSFLVVGIEDGIGKTLREAIDAMARKESAGAPA